MTLSRFICCCSYLLVHHADNYQIKEASSKPSSERILIDVREPHEYNAGFIPTSINIPVSSQPDALFLSADEFEERFGFPKPDLNTEVVFYCKAGVRSRAAANLAEQSGYQKVSEYRGSWLDWQKNGGKTEMP
jgi:rhodanese-related sulfurtransferase